MRKISVILVLLMALCRVCLAIGYQPVPCDSTSYLYAVGVGEGSLCAAPWMRLGFALDVPQHEGVGGDDDAAADIAPVVETKKNNTHALFTLPEKYLQSQNPEYKKVKRKDIEYYSNIKKDVTTLVYMGGGKLCFEDSVKMFLPMSTRNLNDYTVKSFGIRAKYIDYKVPVKQYFHIDLNRSPIHEHYPWESVVPLLLGVLLVLLAKFFMPGYISELFLILFYQNAFMSNVRERNVNADRAGALLMLNYLLNAALFAMVLLYRYDYVFGVGFALSFLSLFVLFVAVYLTKRVLSYVLSSLFGCGDVFELHYKNLSYLMHCLGVFLLCANAGNLYINIQWAHASIFWITAFGIAAAEILKIIRLGKIIFEKHFPVFYLFLYLCAVEFLPVLVAIKMLSH